MARRILVVLVVATLAIRTADAQSVTDCNDQQDAPQAFTETITVTGHRPFRDLPTVEDPRRSLIGIAGSASEGALTAKDIESRPSARPGDLLESVPGLVTSTTSTYAAT